MKLKKLLYISIFTLLFLNLSNISIAQKQFKNKLIYLFSEGSFMLSSPNRQYKLENFTLNYQVQGSGGGNYSIRIFPFKSNIGLSALFQVSRLQYDTNVNINSNFSIISDTKFTFSKNVINLGVTYKFQYKRFLFIPELLLGYRFDNAFVDKTIGSFFKQQNSNNIKSINSSFRSVYPRFNMNFRANALFHIKKYFGLSLALSWDNYQSTIKMENKIQDYNTNNTTQEEFKIKHSTFLVSFGAFFSFGTINFDKKNTK